VVRPGYVTGDARAGVSVTDDFLVRLWKACVQVGARPDIGNSLNAVPVARVARAVAAAALCLPVPAGGAAAAGGVRGGGADGPAFGVAQVTARPRPSLNEWMAALDEYGYGVPVVPYETWRYAVKGYVGETVTPEHEELALLPLFHYVVGDLPADTVAPEMDDAVAVKALEAYEEAFGLPAETGAVDAQTLGVYLAYLVRVGFMPAPKGRGVRELPVLGDVGVLANGHLGGRSAKS
jgi:L-aminoadipate-semialdehyde dehydrogenase